MQSVKALLEDIRNRPGCYVLDKSLSSISALIYGYMMGLEESGNRDTFLDGFPEWARVKLKCSVPRQWDSVISFYTANRDEAFKVFFELLDEYAAMQDAKRRDEKNNEDITQKE